MHICFNLILIDCRKAIAIKTKLHNLPIDKGEKKTNMVGVVDKPNIDLINKKPESVTFVSSIIFSPYANDGLCQRYLV